MYGSCEVRLGTIICLIDSRDMGTVGSRFANWGHHGSGPANDEMG